MQAKISFKKLKCPLSIPDDCNYDQFISLVKQCFKVTSDAKLLFRFRDLERDELTVNSSVTFSSALVEWKRMHAKAQELHIEVVIDRKPRVVKEKQGPAVGVTAIDDMKAQRFKEKTVLILEELSLSMQPPELISPCTAVCAGCSRVVELSEDYRTHNFRTHLRSHITAQRNTASKRPLLVNTESQYYGDLFGVTVESQTERAKTMDVQTMMTSAQILTAASAGTQTATGEMSTSMYEDDSYESSTKRLCLEEEAFSTSTATASSDVILPPELLEHERLLRPLLSALLSGKLQPRHPYYQLLQANSDVLSQRVPLREEYSVYAQWMHTVDPTVEQAAPPVQSDESSIWNLETEILCVPRSNDAVRSGTTTPLQVSQMPLSISVQQMPQVSGRSRSVGLSPPSKISNFTMTL